MKKSEVSSRGSLNSTVKFSKGLVAYCRPIVWLKSVELEGNLEGVATI